MSRSQQRVLGFVNRIRAAYGYKPIKKIKRGARGNASSCPIASSVNGVVRVFGSYIQVRPSGYDPTAAEIKTFKQLCRNLRLSESEADEALVTFKRGRLTTIYTPQYVSEFVNAVDRGRLPQYVG